MTKVMKRSLNKYYHNIGKALVCGGHKRRGIIGNIKDSVACYLSEHPDASMDDIYANFGSEKEVADEYYNYESPETIKKSINRSKVIVISIVITLIIALLIYIATMATIIAAEKEAAGGYAEIYITTISDGDISETDN